jgi:hypothetical protein
MGLLFVYARVVQRRGPSDAARRLSFLGWARIPTPEKDGNLCSVAVRIGSGLSCDLAHIIQPKTASRVHQYCMLFKYEVLVHCRGPCRNPLWVGNGDATAMPRSH